MTLGQRVSAICQQFFLDNVFIIILMIGLTFLVVDLYNRFWRVVKQTDDVDLMARYVWLQMYRRYKGLK